MLPQVRNISLRVIAGQRYPTKISPGLPGPQQAVAGRTYYECDTATVVTNSVVTPRARRLGAANGVTIIDRVHLMRMLQMAGMLETPRLMPPPRCAACDLVLVRRTGKFGPFWGCANYGPKKCRSHSDFKYTLVLTDDPVPPTSAVAAAERVLRAG